MKSCPREQVPSRLRAEGPARTALCLPPGEQRGEGSSTAFLLLLLLLVSTLLPSPHRAEAQALPHPALRTEPFGPFATPAAPLTREAHPEARGHRTGFSGVHFLHLGYRFYQRVVSPIDGPRCRHAPTCSRFAYEAVQKKGVILGVMLGVDRLWNTGRSSVFRMLPEVWTRAGLRFFDPVEQETFWLEGRLGPGSWLLPPRPKERDR